MKRLAKFFAGWIESLSIFPLGYACIIAFTLFSIGDIADWFNVEDEIWISTGLALILGIFGSLRYLYGGEKGTQKTKKFLWMTQIFSLFLSIGYYFLGIARADLYAEHLLFFGIFPVAIVGIFFFIVMTFRKKETKIWLIVREIIESLSLGGLAGLIVRGGLSGALASIEALFDLNFINWHRYEYFASFSLIFLAGSFVLTYFLQLYKQNEEIIESSRLRKIFGCYIVLPLLLIYFAIFFAYGLKILITGTWPKGLIVWLGISYFVFGMVTYYLTYAEETPFYKKMHQLIFSSFLFIALMMAGAIGLRISQYGITFHRYFICAFILVMIAFSLLALLRPKQRFFFFGTLFFGATVLSFYGPLNVTQVSFFSQKQRVVHLAETYGLNLPFERNSGKNLTETEVKELRGAIAGVVEDFAYEKWEDFLLIGFTTEWEDLDEVSRWGVSNKIFEFLGFPENKDRKYQGKEYFYFGQGHMNDVPLKVQGFSYLYYLDDLQESTTQKNVFQLSSYFESLKGKTIDLNPYLEILSTDKNAHSFLIEDGENRLILTRVNGTVAPDGEIEIDYVNGYYLEK